MKKSFSSYLKDYLMLLVLVVLIALFSILGPAYAGRSFFNFPNLLTMLNQNAYLVILGVGITFIMLGGGMDLSTGFLISTVGMAMALIEGSSNVVVAVICGILLAVLLSAFNGVMYSWLKVFPFIITLGTQYILNGVTYLLTDGISKTTYVSSLQYPHWIRRTENRRAGDDCSGIGGLVYSEQNLFWTECLCTRLQPGCGGTVRRIGCKNADFNFCIGRRILRHWSGGQCRHHRRRSQSGPWHRR